MVSETTGDGISRPNCGRAGRRAELTTTPPPPPKKKVDTRGELLARILGVAVWVKKRVAQHRRKTRAL
jgi:hypothetical protein